MKKKLLLLLAIVLTLPACQPDPLTVSTNYMNAVKNGNAEAMLAEVSDDIVLVVAGDPLFHAETSGKEEMRAYIEGNASSGMVMELTGDPVVNGSQITIPTRLSIPDFKAIGVEWITGKDVITIEKGKVVHDVWTLDDTSRDKLLTTFGELQRQFEENLIGGWFNDSGGVGKEAEFHYFADGTYEMVRYVIGEKTLWDKGTYTVQGSVVTYTTTENKYCAENDKGSYEMNILPDGTLQAILIEDGCMKRKPPIDGPIPFSRIME